MEATLSLLLMLQKYTNSKQIIQKWKKYPLSLGDISKDFTSIDMKKTGLNGYAYEFSVDYNMIDTSILVKLSISLKRPLWIFFPKRSAYRKDFDETKYAIFDERRWLL